MLLFAIGAPAHDASAATPAYASDYLMCGWQAPERTLTVSVDPNLASAGLSYDDVIAAFGRWNALYEKYYGFPIFTVYYGNWWEADILLTAHGTTRTWVDTKCEPNARFTGNNFAVVNLGSNDAWRNRDMVAHELGHALGFADFGSAPASEGHIGYKSCGNYIGVMSYCAGPQTWFMDQTISGLVLDGQLVRDYWLP